LLPERHRPGEPAVLDHPFVAGPGGIHEQIEPTFAGDHELECGFRFGVVAVVAPQR
jgi:hypothetical protein